MIYSYRARGVCSREIHFDVENGIVNKVTFTGGCQGNTTGVAKLCEGMKVSDVITKLEGIQCGNKGTSCPDQLAKALKEISSAEKA